MNNDIKHILKWQMEMGVDETISDSPQSILQKSEEIKAKRMGIKAGEVNASIKPAQTYTENSTRPQILQEPDQPATFFNPPPTFKPVAMPKTSAVQKPNSSWVENAKELAQNAKTLAELRAAVESFEGLSIKKSANNTVFAEGSETADIMLIGEAPGENEDIKGVPFCGVSGRLLDEIFRQIGRTRAENLYITNSLFWRPPGNRKPTEEEIEMCRPFVERHIALLNPKIIVLVGATATTSVLKTTESISKLRKTSHKFHSTDLNKDFTVRCIYHPSYLLRQPSQKKTSWFDALEIKKLAETL